MDVSICSADFYVIFNGVKCKVYAIKNTIHHGEYNRSDVIEFLLYLNDEREWFWIYSNRCRPLSEKNLMNNTEVTNGY